MAGPRIFVPGPSVNPNLIGSPGSFLSNIANISGQRRRAQQAENQLAQQKLFQDASLALNERKQDFTEAAPQRAEELRLANLARENEKAGLIQNMSEGLQFSGGARFDTLDSQLLQDPRYAALDDAGKLAARNKYIQSNPSALTPPKQFGDDLRKSLQATGKFTGAEIDAAVSSEIGRRYPTADPAIIKSLLAKPDFKIGTDGTARTGSGGRGGSFSLVSDPTDPKARGEVVDRIAETYELAAKPTDLPLIGRVDVGQLDPAKTDINNAVGMLSAAGVNSPTAQEAAFALAFDEDGTTIKPGFDWRTPEGRQKLVEAGLQSQGTEERIFNKRGGNISRSGQGNTTADVVGALKDYNAGLLSSLTPKALSDAEVVSTFLDSLGAAPSQAPAPVTTRQGSNGGDVSVPEVVSAAPAEESQPETPAEFQIGGPVAGQETLDQIFSFLQENTGPRAIAGAGPLGPILDAAETVAPAAQSLIQSLTPAQGQPILSSTPEPSPREARQAAVDSLTPAEKSNALQEARKLSKQGKINLADGEGRSRDESLLIAYFKYLEGQRN